MKLYRPRARKPVTPERVAKTLAQARALGLKYFTRERRCKNCGGSTFKVRRNRDAGACVTCHRSGNARWSGQNRNALNETQRLRWLAFPERTERHNAVHRALSNIKQRGYASSIVEETNVQELALFYAFARRLSRITGARYEVAHLTPLSRGGLHITTNVAVMSRADNIRQGRRTLFECATEGIVVTPMFPGRFRRHLSQLYLDTVAAGLKLCAAEDKRERLVEKGYDK